MELMLVEACTSSEVVVYLPEEVDLVSDPWPPIQGADSGTEMGGDQTQVATGSAVISLQANVCEPTADLGEVH